MRKILSIFLRTEGTHPALMLGALLLAAACEVLGISALLPAVSLISNNQQGSSAPALSRYLEQFLAVLGLPATLEVILAVVCLGLILKAIITFFALSYAGISAAKVSVRLRQRLIRALYVADWRFYSGKGSGEYAAAISSEASRAGEAYFMSAQWTTFAIQTVFYIGITLLVDWRLALFSLLIGLIISFALHFLIIRTKRAGNRQTEATKALSVSTVELLANLKPLKTMERFSFVDQSIDAGIRKLERSLASRETSRQLLTQSIEVIAALTIAAAIYVAYSSFNVTLDSLVVSGFLLIKSVNNISQLQKLRQQFAHSESAYRRMNALIKEAEDNRETAGGRLPPDTTAAYRVENVSFAYDDRHVLRDINLVVGSREITVLKGLSGSGKTTLVDLLARLLVPQTGRVLLGSVPLSELDLHAMRRRIGYVVQELTLFHTTIRRNICLGAPEISEEQLSEAIRLAGLEQFISTLPLGLETDVGEMGGRLSGGQRQRLALARALVTQPDILILDEVTSSLDPATEAEIVANIKSLSRRFTIIVITHREAWVGVADRLYQLDGGHLTSVPQDAPDAA
ncbi:ABC transporter ATP-binding protein [Aestuariivirga sp.]|uniref:ABC transporter ATP-binding protein n=1 Tax=Aestuariivirga sp. TaxID=2650926 RepID=UPI003BACFEFF